MANPLLEEESALLIPELPELREPFEIREWFVGTLPTSPRQNIEIGGCDFPRRTEEFVMESEDAEVNRNRVMGKTVRMQNEQLAEVVRKLRRKVFRFAGINRSRYEELDDNRADPPPTESPGVLPLIPAPRYRARPGDEPATRYIYILPVERRMGFRLGSLSQSGVFPPSFEEAPFGIPKKNGKKS